MIMRRFAVGVLAVVLGGIALARAAAPAIMQPEHLSALAVNMGALARVRSGTVDILIFRWATREESAALTAAFAARRADGILDVLRDSPRAGYIRTPDNWSYDLRFAWNEPATDGSRRLILATDRRLSLWEAMRRPELGYWFSLIEIRLGPSGIGEGKMALTTKVRAAEGAASIDLGEYDNEPVRLSDVQVIPWFVP
jgi:hypothetical protein